MKIHEYQGKEILRKYNVAMPQGAVAYSVDEAAAVAQRLGGSVWVVKAQIHAGGRGKGGGVKIAKSIGEVKALASQTTRATAEIGSQIGTVRDATEGAVAAMSESRSSSGLGTCKAAHRCATATSTGRMRSAKAGSTRSRNHLRRTEPWAASRRSTRRQPISSSRMLIAER